MITQHPFEKVGLGRAPFRCIGARENWFEMPGFGRKPGGHCHYCGTGLLNEYIIEDADAKTFVVGCECVRKVDADITNFNTIRTEFAKSKRQKKVAERRAERMAQWAKEKEERQKERDLFSAEWRELNQPLIQRLTAYDGKNTFILSMKDSLSYWGWLSPKQVDALNNCFDAEERQANLRIASNHIGMIGQRLKNIPVRVISCKHLGVDRNFYPPRNRYLVKMETETQDQLTWWSSVGAEIGNEYVGASLTVKDHSEYNGVKQTIVNRVKFA